MADVVISASDSLSLPPGFMTYVVDPLFAEWARFSDTRLSQTMLGHLGLNKASWSAMEPEVSGSSEEGESEPGRATEEPSSRALSQGSQESWHTSARRTPLLPSAKHLTSRLSCSPPISNQPLMIFLLFHSFVDLIYLILSAHLPFNMEQYTDTSFGYCCNFGFF